MSEIKIAEQVAAYLNDLLQHDRPAVAAMIANRIPCNEAMANHPTCECSQQHDGYHVGMLGVLNGLCRVIDGEVSFGPIVAVFGEGEEGRFNRLDHFRVATKEEIEWTP